MARVQCAVCGKSVDTSKGNCVINNGIVTHKHCPAKSNLTEQEKSDLKVLKEAIEWACVKYEKPINWVLINTQIRELKDLGYSYADQLYGLKYLVENDGTFWGYGRLKKFMPHAMDYKKKKEEHEAKKEQMKQEDKPKQLKTNSKPSFLDM